MTFPHPDQPRARNGFPLARWSLLFLALAGFLLVFSGQCGLARNVSRAYPSRPLGPEPEPTLLPPPPIDDEYMPCADCHEGEPSRRTVRELDEHDDWELSHGNLWCLDCHQAQDYQRLHLTTSVQVELTESWRLCVRCHGEKRADWRAGVHGKRTGYWRGPKEYRTCVACHRPHSPAFKPLEPKPRPPRAAEIRPPLRGPDGEGSPDDAG